MKIRQLPQGREALAEPLDLPEYIAVCPYGSLHGPHADERGRWIKPRPPEPIGWIGADGVMIRGAKPERRDRAA